MYTTRWGEPIARILISYPTQALQIKALESLIGTAQTYGFTKAKEDIVASVCEGMHPGPGQGLKCRSCWEAEMGVNQPEDTQIGLDPGDIQTHTSAQVYDVDPIED